MFHSYPVYPTCFITKFLLCVAAKLREVDVLMSRYIPILRAHFPVDSGPVGRCRGRPSRRLNQGDRSAPSNCRIDHLHSILAEYEPDISRILLNNGVCGPIFIVRAAICQPASLISFSVAQVSGGEKQISPVLVLSSSKNCAKLRAICLGLRADCLHSVRLKVFCYTNILQVGWM